MIDYQSITARGRRWRDKLGIVRAHRSFACNKLTIELLYFCNLNPLLHRNTLHPNKAIPERGSIPTPGAASQGCLCKYAAGLGFGLRRQRQAKSKKAGAPPAPAFFTFAL